MSFQAELREEAMGLLLGKGFQPQSVFVQSRRAIRPNYTSVKSAPYEIQICEDGADLLVRPWLDEHFRAHDFDDLDALMRSVLLLLKTLLELDRTPFEEAIKAAIQRRIGSSI
jgi:hypothetical protein